MINNLRGDYFTMKCKMKMRSLSVVPLWDLFSIKICGMSFGNVTFFFHLHEV